MERNRCMEIEENEVDVKINDFCERLNLTVLNKGKRQKMHISTYNVARPGLQLAGFYEHFSKERVQVVGEQEVAYLKHMTEQERVVACETLFAYNFPCMVIASAEVLPEVVDAAKKFNRVLLLSCLRTTGFINELSIYLNEILAPTIVMHGGLVDIYGVGVLITGKSSVGKSETALELIKRGHRLVADDAVCIKRISDRLIGEAPETTRHFMEIRGIGLIDVRAMYGASAIRTRKVIDIVVELEDWDPNKEYDRLGDERETQEILQMPLTKYTIPVKPGRNLAAILEVAARSFRLSTMGINALDELRNRLKSRSL